MKIGNIELEHGFALAPMAGVTDRAMRKICKEHGAEYMVSEMISSKGLCYGDKKTPLLAKVEEWEQPIAIQLFGSEPEYMARAAKIIANGEIGGGIPRAIDINMGCPVRKIFSNGEGSALMTNMPLAAEIVNSIAKAISLPVTVKIRSGIDGEHINAPEFAKAMQDAGAAAVCVHARTRRQMYSGKADRDIIAQVKSAVKIPVFGNGDILCAKDAIDMAEQTGCDGVMIGRGAMGNPWIFEELIAYKNKQEFTPPDIAERISVAIKELDLMMLYKGEKIAIPEARSHMSWYIKGIVGAPAARARLNCARSYGEVKEILSSLIQ